MPSRWIASRGPTYERHAHIVPAGKWNVDAGPHGRVPCVGIYTYPFGSQSTGTALHSFVCCHASCFVFVFYSFSLSPKPSSLEVAMMELTSINQLWRGLDGASISQRSLIHAGSTHWTFSTTCPSTRFSFTTHPRARLLPASLSLSSPPPPHLFSHLNAFSCLWLLLTAWSKP